MWYYSGPVFAEFFDSKVREVDYERTYETGHRRMTKGFMRENTYVSIDHNATAAQLRKWRAGVNVKLEVADTLLTDCGLMLAHFEAWAVEHNYTYIIETAGSDHHAVT